MGRCVEKLPHDCGSGDGLQVFENERGQGYNAYCYACDTYIENPYENEEEGYRPVLQGKTEADREAEVRAVGGLPSVALPTRKLRRETLEYFGVRVALSEVDGETPTTTYFPYADGYKAKLIASKNMWAVGNTKGAGFFGWGKALESGGRKVFITEGEEDAMALFQVLKDKNKGTQWADLDPAVVSLPNGAGGAKKTIADNLDALTRNFSEIVLAFDMDKPGEKASDDVLRILPIAKKATLPAKDANACLLEGRSKALANAVLFKATTPKNTRIVSADTLFNAACVPAQWGLSWPWEKLTDITRGIRFGETYYVGAGVKMGKSEFVNAIGVHCMVEHGLKVFMAKPEEANVKTVKMVIGKAVGRFFHDPKIEFDKEAYDKGAKMIGDKLLMLNIYQHLGWSTLKMDIIQAVNRGCKIVFIDPITNLINGINSGEANTVLQGIAQELAAMAKDLDIAIFIFCHLKAPDAGLAHERGGKVYSHQFSGSRAMMRSCNYMIGIEGNKDPDLELEERNVRKVVVLEDREFGSVDYLRLYWDENTGLFNEMKEN